MTLGFNIAGRREIALTVAFWLFIVSPSLLHAGVEIVEVERIQIAKSVSATVTGPGDSPLPGAKVEEMSPDWKQVLRSTQADDAGRFTLAPVNGRRIYYLQISYPNFNPLRVRVSLSTRKGKELRLQLEVAT
jgi:Carboxypeptidase regulatory-like domain